MKRNDRKSAPRQPSNNVPLDHDTLRAVTGGGDRDVIYDPPGDFKPPTRPV